MKGRGVYGEWGYGGDKVLHHREFGFGGGVISLLSSIGRDQMI